MFDVGMARPDGPADETQSADDPGSEADVSLEAARAFHASACLMFSLFRDVGNELEFDYVSAAILSSFYVASAADTLRDVVRRGVVNGFLPGTLTTQSISDMTGIPRETVRRKCLGLCRRGLLYRQADGAYVCTVDTELARGLTSRFSPGM